MNCPKKDCNCCGQVQPIVMPTKVVTKQQYSFCEQPIIYPVEYRMVNRVIMVPRCYYAYVNPVNEQQYDCPRNQ